MLLQTYLETSEKLVNFRAPVAPEPMYDSLLQLHCYDLKFGANGNPLIYFWPEYDEEDVRFTMQAVDELSLDVKEVAEIYNHVSKTITDLPIPAEAIPFLSMAAGLGSSAMKVGRGFGVEVLLWLTFCPCS